ncbi:hypothetical protein ACKLNR_010042 [Fusarium oxysporum f. sp. zingiberi]
MHKVVHLSRYAPTALFGISAKVTFSAPLVAACPANNLNVLVVATPVSVPSMCFESVQAPGAVLSDPTRRKLRVQIWCSLLGDVDPKRDIQWMEFMIIVAVKISDMPFAASVF